MRILIVEDDAAVQQALALVLEQEGYTVQHAADGREGLRAVQSDPPDLIILDLWMPLMNGWTFLSRLHALASPLNAIPVVLATADVRAATQDLPVKVILMKPMDIDRLLAAVRENLPVR